MWRYGVAVVVILLLVLIFVGMSGSSTPLTPAPIRCYSAGKGLQNPKWKNDDWTCPKDSTPIGTCSDDSECSGGYRCDEVCRINCTNDKGDLDETAVNDCGSGYYSEPWKYMSHTEYEPVNLPYSDGGNVLQIKNPFFGNRDRGCSSDNANKLVEEVDAGNDINIGSFTSYFGGDPCPGVSKVTTFDYRYVPV